MLKAPLDSRLFQNSVGGESGYDSYGNRKALSGNRAAPYFMAAFALPYKYAAVLKQNAPQLRIEAVAHELQGNPVAGGLVLLEADAHGLGANIDAVFRSNFLRDFPHALGQSFVGARFCNQANFIAHGNPHAGFGVVGYVHNKNLIGLKCCNGSIHSSEGYNKFELLTNPVAQAYPSRTTDTSVVGFDILDEAAIGRKVSSNAAFLLPQCARSLRAGWAGAARPPVRFSGMSTCLVPPTRLTSGSGSFNELRSEHIMTNTPLVPVFTGTISNQSIQLCNARDLHCFLGVGTKFADWINNRINQYGFVKDEDYFLNSGNRSDGKAGKGRTKYHLTLDMAKELAMVENNDKGRQIRRYFISLERKALKALPPSEPKRYNYPRQLLEQPYFKSATSSARLSISMLSNTESFISPLFCLLNELQTDGHDIQAAWDEAIAMREAIVRANETLEDIYLTALRAANMPSKVALKGKR